MHKSLVVLALYGTIIACAAPQQAAIADAAKPAASPQTQAQTRVCEEFEKESTGTRLGTEKVCKTVPDVKDKTPQTS